MSCLVLYRAMDNYSPDHTMVSIFESDSDANSSGSDFGRPTHRAKRHVSSTLGPLLKGKSESGHCSKSVPKKRQGERST